MSTRQKLGRALPLGFALLLAAAPATGRQNDTAPVQRREARQAQRMERQEARHETAISRLAGRLELTEDQQKSVSEAMQVDEETGNRGDGWVLAAVLDRELTEDQMDKLFETSHNAAIYRRGVRDGSTGRAGNRPARGMQVAAGLRKVRIQSMQKALQLTDRQVRVLRIHQALTNMSGARAGVRNARTQRGRRFSAGMRMQRGSRGVANARMQRGRRFGSGARFGR